ncbi:hypothetical protein QE400_004200 [Xanthomonas sacchari]|nr:hypothetical protein [Xanthomonas sacchari]
MTHQHQPLDLRQRTQPRVRGTEFRRRQAEPVHAAVQLQPQAQRLRRGEGGDRLHLPGRGDRAPQPVFGDQRQFLGVEDAFQQQDRRGDAGLAQLQRLLDAGHREAVGLAVQRARAGHRAVPIGIGLDHRQRFAAAQPAGQAVVVAQRVEVDQCTGWAHATASATDAAEPRE